MPLIQVSSDTHSYFQEEEGNFLDGQLHLADCKEYNLGPTPICYSLHASILLNTRVEGGKNAKFKILGIFAEKKHLKLILK